MTIQDTYAARRSTLFDTLEHAVLTFVTALAFTAVAAAAVIVMISMGEAWDLITGQARELG